MDGSEVSVLEEGDEVGLSSLLKSHDRGGLEAEIRLQLCQLKPQQGREGTNFEILRDFTNETLERQLANEQLRRLLIPTDLTKSDGTRPETMGLLHTTSRRLKQRVSTTQSPHVRTNSQQQSYEPQTWQRAAYAVPYLTNKCL